MDGFIKSGDVFKVIQFFFLLTKTNCHIKLKD